MSDIRPRPEEIEVEGKNVKILFSIGAVADIQEECNMPIWDVMECIAKAAGGVADKESVAIFAKVLAILINDRNEEKVTEDDIKRTVHIRSYAPLAGKLLRAFGIAVPDPDEEEDLDEEDEDSDEEEDPKSQTGR